MDSTSIKQEVLESHIARYFRSLKVYAEKYLPLFNYTVENQVPHVAYMCPLCVTRGLIVTEEFGLGMHDEFSLDHYPPKSVGGFETVLVCKKCNSYAGDHYDFTLKQKINDISFGRRIPASSKKTKSKITDVIGNYPGLFTITETGEMEISLKPYERIHAPFLDKFIEYSKSNNDY